MKILVSADNSQLMARFGAMPDRLRKSVLRVVTRLAIEAQGYVKEGKLTGQVLHVRTGTLRRSINQKVTENQSGVTATIGTNLKYAKPHEYGFDGVVTVKEHVRRSARQMREALRKSKSGKTYYTRKGMRAGEITVQEHTRHMHIPERSFLRSALKDMAPKIKQELEKAAKEALK